MINKSKPNLIPKTKSKPDLIPKTKSKPKKMNLKR